jgi:hypothetical protein
LPLRCSDILAAWVRCSVTVSAVCSMLRIVTLRCSCGRHASEIWLSSMVAFTIECHYSSLVICVCMSMRNETNDQGDRRICVFISMSILVSVQRWLQQRNGCPVPAQVWQS